MHDRDDTARTTAPAGDSSQAPPVIRTARLALRRFGRGDGEFMLRLLNDPAWLEHIGDRGARTVQDAVRYIEEKLLALYRDHGFGLWLVERRHDGAAVGMCGLVKRAGLDDVDLGFALLAEHRGRGYAFESATAVMNWAHEASGLTRLVALTSRGNDRSERLLARLGFRFERDTRMPDGDTLRLFCVDLVQPPA